LLVECLPAGRLEIVGCVSAESRCHGRSCDRQRSRQQRLDESFVTRSPISVRRTNHSRP